MTPDQRPADSSSRHLQASVRPTLEELLRLKRAEEPDAEFWREFEHGMRHKQLAAIIEPKPWWLGLSRLVSKLPVATWPVGAGVGAAAVLAFTLSQTAAPERVGVSRPKSAAVVALAPEIVEGASEVMVASEASVTAVAVNEPGVVAVRLEDEVAAFPEEMAQASGHFSQPLTGEPVSSPDTSSSAAALGLAVTATEDMPSLIASYANEQVASDATLEVVSDELDLGSELETVPFTERQERLLAMAQIDPLDTSRTELAQLRERVVHRIYSDEGRYAAVSRVGVGADRLSLKF